MGVEITYDPVKNDRNIRERGLSFDEAAGFEFGTALVGPVFRNSEWRLQSLGYLKRRLHLLCYKSTPGGIRVISLRKASEREAEQHGLEVRR